MKKSGKTLQIKMFGKFSMSNENYSFPQEKRKANKLAFYLLIFWSTAMWETSKSKLIEVLWPEETAGIQGGALRT